MTQNHPPGLAQTWQKILDQLRLQMPRAAYDTWIKETQLLSTTNDVWQIGVQSAYAQDWLENRLDETIRRTICQITDQQIELEFVVITSTDQSQNEETFPAAELDEDLDEIQPALGVALAQTTDFYAAKQQADAPIEAATNDNNATKILTATDFYAAKRDMGRWLPEFQYDHFFVQPFLGSSVYGFYRHLLMHWISKLEKEDMHLLDLSKRENQTWTPPFKLSYRDALRALNKSNQKIIPGGEYECHTSYTYHQALKQPLPACCQAHEFHQWRPCDGGGHCYFWRPGYLHKLYEVGLLKIEILRTNRALVQVWRLFPWLTPVQVSGLDPVLQEDHEEWLDKNGHYFNLTLAEWKKITLPSILSHQPTYSTFILQGRPPVNPFITS